MNLSNEYYEALASNVKQGKASKETLLNMLAEDHWSGELFLEEINAILELAGMDSVTDEQLIELY